MATRFDAAGHAAREARIAVGGDGEIVQWPVESSFQCNSSSARTVTDYVVPVSLPCPRSSCAPWPDGGPYTGFDFTMKCSVRGAKSQLRARTVDALAFVHRIRRHDGRCRRIARHIHSRIRSFSTGRANRIVERFAGRRGPHGCAMCACSGRSRLSASVPAGRARKRPIPAMHFAVSSRHRVFVSPLRVRGPTVVRRRLPQLSLSTEPSR